MARVDFLQDMHSSTSRDYVERVVSHDKAACAEVAVQFGAEYWDGPRQYGYGGYSYDGRWLPMARTLADHYGLQAGHRVLDIGCGKAYLAYELTQAIPGLEVFGIDISHYGLMDAKPELQHRLVEGTAASLPFETDSFDFVFSLATFHNLPIPDVMSALREMERVGKGAKKYFMVESWRNEAEKANLLYWQLTCQSFHDTDGWGWLAKEAGYSGDHGFIFFT